MHKVLQLFIILLATTLSFSNAKGQFVLKVNDKKAEPVAGAKVFIIPIEKENPYSLAKAYFTNNKGLVNSTIGGVCAIEVSGEGFKTITDTVKLVAGNIYIVALNQLEYVAGTTIVTGQYAATTADKSVSKVRIIDAKRIQAQGAVNLKDVLSNELNIRLSQDNILGSSLSLQGVGGQNIKILIDGVPMIGRLNGNIDISQINMNNIERIEIIEGPMSVMYGTDALGGVINLITKKTTKHSVEGNVNTYYESVGNYNIDGRIAFKTKNRTTVQVSGGRNFFDGFGGIGLRGRVQQWKPKEQYFVDGIIGFKVKNSTHRIQTTFFDELLLNRGAPVVKPYTVYAFDNYFYTRRLNNSLFSNYKLKNGARINIINSYSWFRRNNLQQRRDLVTLEDNLTKGVEDHDTSVFTLVMSRGTYTQSINRKVSFQLGYDINLETVKGGRIQGDRQEIGDYAGYATVEYRPLLRWVLRPGLRVSHNTRYGAPITPSFNTKYTINNKLNIRASYARGFRSPSLKELNLFFVDINHNIQPNPNLEAEVSDNINVSAVYSHKFKNKVALSIEPSLFYNDIRNMISLALVNPATQLYNYINVEQFNNAGTNLSVQIKMGNLAVQMGTALIAFRNTINAKDIPEYRTTHEYRANINYTLKKTGTGINLFYKYNSAAPNFSVNANNETVQSEIEGYAMADISITQPFGKHIMLVVGAKNLFNVGNINLGTAQGGPHAGAGSMAIAMGRTIFTSIRINLFNKK